MRWAIYYDNNSIFNSEDGKWEEAPIEGVLVVVEKTNDRVVTHTGGDFYYLIEEDNTIVSTDDSATLLRGIGLPGRNNYGCIKFGRYTSNSKMNKILKDVHNDWIAAK